MKNNLEYAYELLKSGGYTLVLKSDDEEIVSHERGVKPLVKLIDSGRTLEGFSAADKVVGKAAAFLYAKLNVKEIYAGVMSKSAMPVLNKYNILYRYTAVADTVKNRNGDGICPMEQTVLHLDSVDRAYQEIKNKLGTL